MSKISYLLLSDIHFGHNVNKAKNIKRNLDIFFNKFKKELTTVDMIIIAGDVFDRLLGSNHPDTLITYQWLTTVANFCMENNIKLRILEGTPSHDWKQVKPFYEIINNLKLQELDYKYYDILDIEIMEDIGISILYIPDEWKENSESIYRDVESKLKEHGLNKIDMIVMHGAFRYQLPNLDLDILHDENIYNEVVNYTVNCGHVHDHSVNGKIIVPGSFDRLTFIDEDKQKGCCLVTIDKSTKSYSYRFLENEHALIFKTIRYDGNIDKLIELLTYYNDMDKNIQIRILYDNNFMLTRQDIKYDFPHLRIKIEKIKNNNDTMRLTINKEQHIKHEKIDRNYIEKYIEERSKSIDGIDHSLLMEELKIIYHL